MSQCTCHALSTSSARNSSPSNGAMPNGSHQVHSTLQHRKPWQCLNDNPGPLLSSERPGNHWAAAVLRHVCTSPHILTFNASAGTQLRPAEQASQHSHMQTAGCVHLQCVQLCHCVLKITELWPVPAAQSCPRNAWHHNSIWQQRHSI